MPRVRFDPPPPPPPKQERQTHTHLLFPEQFAPKEKNTPTYNFRVFPLHHTGGGGGGRGDLGNDHGIVMTFPSPLCVRGQQGNFWAVPHLPQFDDWGYTVGVATLEGRPDRDLVGLI